MRIEPKYFGWPMRNELHYYDIWPKVVLSGTLSKIHIKPLDSHVAFEPGKQLKITIIPLERSAYQLGGFYDSFIITPNEGKLVFDYLFNGEQEYVLSISEPEEDTKSELFHLSIYAVLPDLGERIPLRGDLHVHTKRSDGRESPEFVAAVYRKHGFDFMAITEHLRWEPSEEAINAFKDLGLCFYQYNGEEIHAPDNPIHIINFAGKHSVNAIYQADKDAYYSQVNKIMDHTVFPPKVDPFVAASCIWVTDRIREAEGLSIFCHPYWRNYAYNADYAMVDYLLTSDMFDCFELLGAGAETEGVSIPSGTLQLAKYFELQPKMRRIGIVGSSDSHGVVNIKRFKDVSTVLLTKSAERTEMISAIKDGYSAAITTYPEEHYRVYSSFRITKYTAFLMEHYFPLHDELCFEEGRIMKDYVGGDSSMLPVLELIKNRTEDMRKKYFPLAFHS